MSIPRTAIQRPVTMFMLSGVIILLGMHVLFRLPVDLMPDVSYPSLTVRVGYPGVGPLEIEAHHAPHRQAMSAVAGLERLESTAAEGSSRTTLNFAWGTDLNEAADDVRNRPIACAAACLRSRRAGDVQVRFQRHTQSWASASRMPIASPCVSWPSTTCASSACPVWRRSRLRRPPPADPRGALQGEGPGARSAGRPHHRALAVGEQNIPVGEIDEEAATYLVRSQGQFENLEIREMVVMTRQGVPVYLKDIAGVKDSTEDLLVRASAGLAFGCA